jgi:hypothetical protein
MVFIYMGLIWAFVQHKEELKEHCHIFVLKPFKAIIGDTITY